LQPLLQSTLGIHSGSIVYVGLVAALVVCPVVVAVVVVVVVVVVAVVIVVVVPSARVFSTTCIPGTPSSVSLW